MNKTFLIIPFILLCFWLKAQEDTTKTLHFVTSAGGSFTTIQDEGISPLRYDGIGGGGAIGHFYESSKNLNSSLAQFQFNLAESDISGASIYVYKVNADYQHYWKRNQKDQKWDFYPGFATGFNWILRHHQSYTNNSQHIETRIYLAPALFVSRDFTLWNRNFTLGMTSNLPLLNYATRPLYASTKFRASLNKDEPEPLDYISNGEIVSWGSYFKWNNQFFLSYPFKNGNRLRLDYLWSLENYQAINPITSADHTILISTFLKL